MRCCLKPFNVWIVLACLVGLLFGQMGDAYAEGVVVEKTSSVLSEKGYQFNVRYKITLSPAVEDALRHGVVLNFVSTVAITRTRSYWLDEEIVHNEQVTKLSYHALTKQFRIARGSLFQGFTDLEGALRVLGYQTTRPFSPELFNVTETYLQKMSRGYLGEWLKKGVHHVVEVQMKLDATQLPKPLQINALTGNEWNLTSPPYRWQFFPLSKEDEGGDAP